jgi:purine nucleosidase
MQETIIIDTDPGQDDAVAILLALASPERFSLPGMTAVAGNVPVTQTAANVIRICDLAGETRMPVFAGAEGPIVFALETAEFVCGPDGLAGADLPPPSREPNAGHAVSFIIDTLRRSDEASVTLCPLGPLTNIALALRMAPDIKSRIKRIVLMGGAMNLGNITPAAEFNFHVDPHAAAIVLESGLPIVMMGLNVTLKAIASHDQVARIGALGTKTGKAIHGMLTRPRPGSLGSNGHPMHDACVIAYLIWPDLFRGRDCFVSIDTSDTILRGRSTVDWNGRLRLTPNAFVADEVDAGPLFDRMIDVLSTLP